METENKAILENNFGFLTIENDFKIRSIRSYSYALYAKFMSKIVGIYFSFEYRDFLPRIQFSLLSSPKLEPRVGLYTLVELYKNKDFILNSFYLDEIIQFRKGEDYRKYFEKVESFEDAIIICAQLIKKYAKDFVLGNIDSYKEIDGWLRMKIQGEN